MAATKTKSAPALERALNIIELLATSRKGLSLSHITHHLNLPRSSTYYLLLTLERRGYLARHPHNGRYLFGLKLFSLANMALANIKLQEEARPFLKALMERTHLTVHMAIPEQNEAVLIDKVEPAGLLKLATWIGKRMEVHCTGLGKALIAYWTGETLDTLIKEHGLPRHNHNTVSSARKLREELERVRYLGYSFDNEEDEVGLRCIGSPIFDHAGNVAAAISLSGTTAQITLNNVASLAQQVKQTASSISQVLGFNNKKPAR